MRHVTNLYLARNVCLGQTQLYNAVLQSKAICHKKISMNLENPSDALLLNITDWNLCSNRNRLLFEIDSESNTISLDCMSQSLGTGSALFLIPLLRDLVEIRATSRKKKSSWHPTKDVVH